MWLQVLGEDLVLVQGQQRRMERGGDTWSNPVSYDKLAVRCASLCLVTNAGSTSVLMVLAVLCSNPVLHGKLAGWRVPFRLRQALAGRVCFAEHSGLCHKLAM